MRLKTNDYTLRPLRLLLLTVRCDVMHSLKCIALPPGLRVVAIWGGAQGGVFLPRTIPETKIAV